jgi:hypothetical protein
VSNGEDERRAQEAAQRAEEAAKRAEEAAKRAEQVKKFNERDAARPDEGKSGGRPEK